MRTDQEKDLPIETIARDLMGSDCPLNKARREFSAACARIQAMDRRATAPIVVLRRMEFEAVRKIALALGVQISDDGKTVSYFSLDAPPEG